MSLPVILPGGAGTGQPTTLGVMGGGQLGRMFAHAAQRMGYFTAVLDPDAASPAGLVSHDHIQTDYLDEQGLAQLMQRCAAITTEFENVPAPALQTLGAHRPVAPAAESVAIAQDRIKEKAHFVRCGVPCAPYAVLQSEADLTSVADALLPGILKTARLGYDGRGQVRVRNRAELAAAWASLQGVPCVLEQLLPLQAEVSVIVARGWDGAMVNYPPQANLHPQAASSAANEGGVDDEDAKVIQAAKSKPQSRSPSCFVPSVQHFHPSFAERRARNHNDGRRKTFEYGGSG